MDNLWNFLKSDAGRSAIALCAILASVLVAMTIFLLNRKRKALVYEILSKTRVLTVKEEVVGRVIILFDKKEVKEVGLVQIKVTNTGTEPIRESDFVRPISFSVTSGAHVIDAEIVEKKPKGIDASIELEDDHITLFTTLLNSKDEITLKFLVANFDGKVVPDARIEGAEMKEVSSRGIPLLKELFSVLAGAAATILVFELAQPWSTIFAVMLGILVGLYIYFSRSERHGD